MGVHCALFKAVFIMSSGGVVFIPHRSFQPQFALQGRGILGFFLPFIVIYRKDSKSDTIVQVYLSFFTLFRLVEMGPKISRQTFSSMSAGCGYNRGYGRGP